MAATLPLGSPLHLSLSKTLVSGRKKTSHLGFGLPFSHFFIITTSFLVFLVPFRTTYVRNTQYSALHNSFCFFIYFPFCFLSYLHKHKRTRINKLMSLLLLDDDDVFVPPAKSAKSEPLQVLDSDVDNVNAMTRKPSIVPAVSLTTTPLNQPACTATTSPSAATRTKAAPSQDASRDAAAMTFACKGGDGMAKMEALMFGMPKVSVVNGDERSPSAKPVRRSTVSLDDVLAAAVSSTPTGQRSTPSATPQWGSEVRSTVSSSTQPKIVSGARSPMSLSSPSQRQASIISLHNSQESVVVEGHEVQTSPGNAATASPSTSPPAHPPVKPAATASADATPTQAAKTQLKLSDFFSKMACKR